MGLEKLGWQQRGHGKSGGARIIYYFKKNPKEIWLLTIYAKNEIENLPLKLLKEIAKELEL